MSDRRVILTNESDEVKVSATERGSKGALAVELLDENGDQITDFIGSGAVAPTTPNVANIDMVIADKEYAQALSAGTRKFDIKLRALNATLKVAYTASFTEYITIPYGASMHVEDVNLTGVTLYFKSTTANQVAEIQWFT